MKERHRIDKESKIGDEETMKIMRTDERGRTTSAAIAAIAVGIVLVLAMHQASSRQEALPVSAQLTCVGAISAIAVKRSYEHMITAKITWRFGGRWKWFGITSWFRRSESFRFRSPRSRTNSDIDHGRLLARMVDPWIYDHMI